MAARQFYEFQKDMAGQTFENPAIIFQNNTVTVVTKGLLRDKIVLMLLALPFPLSLIDWPWLIFGALFLPIWLNYFYSQFIGVGTLEIDFLTETVKIRNASAFLNWLRSICRVKTEFAFSSIIDIGHKHGPFLDRIGRSVQRRSLIYFETDSDWEIYAGQFKNEEEAENLVNALQKFVHDKEEIIA